MRKIWIILLLMMIAAQSALAAPRRVVSIGGGVTEIVYALGAQDRLVATDDTSDYPTAAHALPKVGYARALSAEGLLSFRPDTVLLTDEAGPAPVLKQVEDTGVRVVRLNSDHTIDGVIRNIEQVAKVLGTPRAGAAFIRRLKAEAAQLARINTGGTQPRVMFILQTGGGSPMVSGQGTAADAMIRLASGHNVADSYKGYKPLTPEAVMLARPDILLVTRQGLDMMGGAAGLRRSTGLATLPPAQHPRIVSMDTMLLLGFGPRTAAAARLLRTELYKDRP